MEKRDHYPDIDLSRTDEALPEGLNDSFRRYKNFSVLSAGGGNGLLRSCFDTTLNRWVALKSLKRDQTKDQDQRRRLLREARVTAQLQHPNTVPVYDLGLDYYNDVYFTMKRIEGEDLFQVIQRLANKDEATLTEWSLDRLLGALTQVTNTLDYAHNHGVIHRDVKPENVLVGTYGEVYLMDWGVSLVMGMDRSVPIDDDVDYIYSRLTVTGKRPGTPLYMSPEQIGGADVDHRTDIFSMGVVLYEALTAREPFRGRNIQETFGNIQKETPPPPSEAARYRPVPRGLDEICMTAMAKDPDDRYQTSADLVRAIRRFRNEALTEANLDD